MKNTFFLLAFSTLAFSSCNKDNDLPPSQDGIVGTWNVTDYTVEGFIKFDYGTWFNVLPQEAAELLAASLGANISLEGTTESNTMTITFATSPNKVIN